jgi:hypothetical protein
LTLSKLEACSFESLVFKCIIQGLLYTQYSDQIQPIHLDHPLLLKIMASFSIDEFVGNGVLKGLLPKLLEEGWDDVPTLKIMTSEDMDALNMTQQEKVGYQQISFS